MWTITGRSYFNLELQFQDINLPYNQDCNDTDHIEIWEYVPNGTENSIHFN